MAFLDPNATNMALKKLGSDYQMDVPAPSAPPVAEPTPAPVAAAPTAPPATVTVNAPAPVAAPTPAPSSGSTGPDISAAGQVASGAQAITAGQGGNDKPGLKKLAAMIGTAANLYTGNYAGAATSAAQLAG